ncbi:MAG: hypothetical protein CVV64_19205 [Candidatus Wallbacteria bacterium HGW-Wallbacteria-1]|jgi:hypothetical protein|uniref:Clostripain n=1 Tax=Candidatus Wallbacteria bacterium HGW-Wallbacteria-1 TaxID=2013854 RepID=A0A2N1PJ36_9BACT|nr:MAG: hypothetical protein CVV64_19205 [Candidatus Wallbacteria bacterium HGW-Wallbacteria-1]
MMNSGLHSTIAFVSLALIFSVMLSVSASAAPAAAPAALDDWTIMYYAVGEAKIQDDQITALNQINESHKPGRGVNFICQFDYQDKPAQLYVLKDKFVIMGSSSDGTISDNMGNPETLYKFLKYGITNYPASHYALIIDSHGSGIESYRGAGSTADRPVSFREFWKSFYEMDDILDATAYDYDDNDCLTLVEARGAIMKAMARHNEGRRLDVMFNAACWQMMAEWNGQIRDCVKYVIACPTTCYCSAPAVAGFIHKLCRNKLTPLQVAQRIAEDYIDDVSKETIIAAIDSEQYDDFILAFNRWLYMFIRELPDSGGVGFKSAAFVDPEHDGNQRFVSFRSLISSVLAGKLTFKPSAKLLEAARALSSQYDKCLAASWRKGYEGAGGMSIYFPIESKQWKSFRNHYAVMNLAVETLWDEYLDFARGVEGPEGSDKFLLLVRGLKRLHDEVSFRKAQFERAEAASLSGAKTLFARSLQSANGLAADMEALFALSVREDLARGGESILRYAAFLDRTSAEGKRDFAGLNALILKTMKASQADGSCSMNESGQKKVMKLLN